MEPVCAASERSWIKIANEETRRSLQRGFLTGAFQRLGDPLSRCQEVIVGGYGTDSSRKAEPGLMGELSVGLDDGGGGTVGEI